MQSLYSHRFKALLALLVLGSTPACNDQSEALREGQAQLERDQRRLEERIASLERKLESASAKIEALSRPGQAAGTARLPTATLSCPAGWRALGASGQLLAGCEGPVQQSGFAINCNVAASAADGSKTAEQYFDEAFKSSPQLQGAKRVRDRSTTLLDLPAHEAMYTHTLGPEPLTALATIVVRKGLSIAVTCTAPRAQMDALEPTFSDVLRSLRIEP